VLHFIERTPVHAARSTASRPGRISGVAGGRVGSGKPATPSNGCEDTAVEIDKVGQDGLRRIEKTIQDLDRDGKKMVVGSSDGIESTVQSSIKRARPTDPGKEIARETDKGAKVRHHNARHVDRP
jgi:hypothetical protein